ncbi:hypothetical protein [Ruixingdingia sedimenti]|uniref:Uncharacterized protein n=1 Tax=Ruixingdingia sedimenti TaxID=3073604 RepID=A0ABU1F7F0_9RHOB|nr:hypothetical protein [Xinfangfangia sp. LG-4]MDR5652374.1 hypothetical protein [Xinfangfangia sp. LG-4]
MRHRFLAALLSALLAALPAAAPAQAACYADYKAKRDGPLRLHYGVIELPAAACDPAAAAPVIAARIRADGWVLLNVMSVFGPEGLNQRKASAGPYFLRY